MGQQGIADGARLEGYLVCNTEVAFDQRGYLIADVDILPVARLRSAHLLAEHLLFYFLQLVVRLGMG
ncbi:MAG: hypothetical protein V1737_06260 [Chloroflexota bacterium]